jgi:protein-L-isoaspartate(D-aspartate) O-methyltransferase
MTPEKFRLRIAMVVVLTIGLGWLLTARPWQRVTPEPTPSPAPSAEPLAPELAIDSHAADRARMVETQIRARGVSDEAILAAMEVVPRHRFVPADLLGVAHGDHPLPIGYGQTISQPYIVAWMTELLGLSPGARVLEIGTGSGYQAAILGQMDMEVYTIEIVEPLAIQAMQRLGEMGYEKIMVSHADGYYGWEEHAPFDAIIVTCAPDHVPQPLVQQLADGGRMVLPVGPPGGYQSMWLVEKLGDEVKTTEMGGVMFVPLTGEH